MKQLQLMLLVCMAACPEGATAAARSLHPIPGASIPLEQRVSGDQYRQQIEADWLRQAEALAERGVSPGQADARGACDGVKNGKYGFHTAPEQHPWWQVDLEETKSIERIVVFNRLDYAPGLHNADRLRILTSDDGREWKLRHENQGHFGGIAGAKPLQFAFPQVITARFVRLQVQSDRPIFFHLDEVEVYGPGEPGQNIALHKSADQSSVSQWSTSKPLGGSRPLIYPTGEFLQRGRDALEKVGKVNRDSFAERLDTLQQRWMSLSSDAPDDVRRKLYLETRWMVRQVIFSNPLLNFDRLLFVKRFTQETYPDICLNHMPWVSRPGGDICILSGPPGRSLFAALANPAQGTRSSASVHQILNRALGPGHVHGMDLWWDGDRVVFGFARAQSDSPPSGWLDRSRSYELRRSQEPIHIYEVGIDGKNLRQITSGEWSDLDPAYAPNGDIVFVSERCGTSLQCNEYDKDETSCNLYVMKADGSGIRRMSVNKDGDYLPHTLDDGTIAYTRWEYHERSWAFIQSLWTIRPDGTGADAIFKQHFVDPWAIEDARSIPNSPKLVAIAAGHHTLAVGPLVVLSPSLGINEPAGISIVTPYVKPPEGGMSGVPVAEGGVQDAGGYYSTPWALSEQHFLVSYSYSNKETEAAGYGLYLVDVFGNKELLYRDAGISSFIPIPLRSRPKPPVLPDAVDLASNEATCILSDASFGTEGLMPGQARYIRIAEPIGWPYDNEQGGQRYGEDHRYGGPEAARRNLMNWTPIRILGDVPLESDGSAHFKVPADTAVYFQLLDKNRMELRRMRSFISFQPGEKRSCVGCHESQGISPPASGSVLAAAREPVVPLLPPWGDRPVSFLRDIQPVLDRNCVSCHSGFKPAGGLDFFGGLVSYDQEVPDYGHNRAYETIMANDLVSISKVREQDASITPPFAYGAHKSKLLLALVDAPHPEEVSLSEEERLRLVMWIDANAPYHDNFVNKRAAVAAYDLVNDGELKADIAAVHERRCGQCHSSKEITRLDWVNVLQPQKSLFLAAPLANEWGGTQRCGNPVYRNLDDPDYQVIRDLLALAMEKARKAPRRDLQALWEKQSAGVAVFNTKE